MATGLTGTENAAFRSRMAELGLSPLWEQYDTSAGPRGGAPPGHVWRWAELEPMIELAIRATGMDGAERRALTLRPPGANAPGPGVTANLTAAVQVLMPGETAPPHRHSMNALRFVMEGEGAETIVDGKPCPMAPGDLILTPGWTWHAHVHRGSVAGSGGRMVWLDGLDVPVHAWLGTAAFEPGPPPRYPELPSDAAFAGAGLVPETAGAAQPYAPLFRYPWENAARALALAPPAADGVRRLRYTNPLTGGSALPLIDCFLVGLAGGRTTRPLRSTGSAVCLVVAGAGRTSVGETELAWERHSIFTLPHGNWISHRAEGAGATLFMMTDRDLMHRLGLLRDEHRDNPGAAAN